MSTLKINRWWFAFSVYMLVSLCLPASAEIPVSRYADYRTNIPAFKNYLVGLGRGVFWANVLLKTAGKLPLFCMPSKLALDEGIILSLIDQEIRNPSSGIIWSDDDSVEMIMAVAFMKRFPCLQ